MLVFSFDKDVERISEEILVNTELKESILNQPTLKESVLMIKEIYGEPLLVCKRILIQVKERL